MRNRPAQFKASDGGAADTGAFGQFVLRQEARTTIRPDATRQVLTWINSRRDDEMIQCWYDYNIALKGI